MSDFQIPDKDLLTSVDRSADTFLVYDNSASGLKRTNVNYALDLTSHPVGIDDVQTLTNKTLTAPSVSSPVLSGTLTGTYTLGGTPTFPAAVVTLTGSQTLTNKVLTSPTINNPVIANPTLTVDAISEYTSAAGVTIDGVLLKDSKMNGSYLTDASVPTAALADDSVTAAKIDWASTGANGGIWWEELGKTTLSGAGDTITVSSFAARKYLKILVWTLNSGQIEPTVRFNNDSANNYALRVSNNGGADSTSTARSNWTVMVAPSVAPMLFEITVINVATSEKLGVISSVEQNTAGAANAPQRTERVGKWANTTDQITRIDIINAGTGDFAIGSEVRVLGHD